MNHLALDIRARYSLVVVFRTIYGEDAVKENEAHVYSEAYEMGVQSFVGGDPTLPFLFRGITLLTRAWKAGFAAGYETSVLQMVK